MASKVGIVPSHNHAWQLRLSRSPYDRLAPPGFTLIELLVVIAIIALLMAILIPSLRTAKELARRTVCQTHMHTVGLGIGLYGSDNDAFLPPSYVQLVYTTSPSVTYWVWDWSDSMAKYYDPAAMPTKLTSACMLSHDVGEQPSDYNYVRMGYDGKVACICSQVLNCPSQKNTDNRHYAWNGGWIISIDPSTQAKIISPKPLRDLNYGNPARYVQIIDGGGNYDTGTFTGYAGWPGGYDWIVNGAPHLNGYINAMYLDGHVGTFSPSEVMYHFNLALQAKWDYPFETPVDPAAN